MSPTLADGDYVLVVPLRVRVGDIAWVAHPWLGAILKRVVRKDGTRVELAGENSLSTQVGEVDACCVRGRAVARVSPRGLRWL